MRVNRSNSASPSPQRIARWWMPDDVVVVDEIPLGATGKIDKKLLRQRMAGYVLPELASR